MNASLPLSSDRLVTPSWSSQRERGSRIALLIVTALYRIIGRRICFLLLYPVTLYFFLFSHRTRRASLEFLSHVFRESPKAPWFRILFRSYRHLFEFAVAIFDKISVWHGDIPIHHIAFHGRERLRGLLDAGQGAVVFGAHLGNMEILRAVSEELRAVRVNALMFTSHNQTFNTILEQINSNSSLRVIRTEGLTPELISHLQDLVKRGEIVALLADRITPGAPEKRQQIAFFREKASFPEGPFILASLLHCPAFLIFCVRESYTRYNVYFEDFADEVYLPRQGRKEALSRYMNRFVQRLEYYCRRYPMQWFNFFPFWENENGKGNEGVITRSKATR